MSEDNNHTQNGGPEIIGPRLTVYHLLPYFLNPTMTEAEICRIYDLTPNQVAAARAYVLSNPDTVLAEHMKIEARLSVGNPPEVIEQAKRAKETFKRFREWLAKNPVPVADPEGERPGRGPTFREWLAEQNKE